MWFFVGLGRGGVFGQLEGRRLRHRSLFLGIGVYV